MTRLVAIVLGVGVAACSANGGRESITPTASEGGTGMDDAMVQRVVDMAATQHDLDAGAIEVVSAEAVTWRDGSLGCPEAGMAYTQALVPGYRVVLDVAGTPAHYHAGSEGEFFHCENPQDSFDSGPPDR